MNELSETARREISRQSQHDRRLIHVAQHRAGKASRSGVLFFLAFLLLVLLLFGGLLWFLPRSPRPVTEADIPSGISPELRSLIQDTFSLDEKKRAEAAERLGDMGERAGPAAPFVIRLVRDRARLDVSESALENRDGTSVGSVARAAIAKIGTSAVDLLLAQMSDFVAENRFWAVFGVERCTDPRVVMPLIARFKDYDAAVRSCAVLHFYEHRDPRVVRPLLDMLADRDVREQAITALGKQGDQRSGLVSNRNG